MKNFDLSLYLCTDRNLTNGKTLENCVESAIKGGVTAVQVREKNCSDLKFFQVAISMKKITEKYKIPLIINDRVDIALAVNADGVHIGQDDLPCEVVKKIVGEKIIGVSVSTVEQALNAEKFGADYLGVGAIFPTSTKDDANAVSIEALKKICDSVKIPVVAIGGINLSNLSELKATNIAGVAVVSAIISAENPEITAKEMIKIFKS